MKNKIFIIRGTSMSPVFRPGDRAYVRKPPWDRLKTGDLVATQPPGSKHPIIHRLVGWQTVNDRRFGILKGDNLPVKDDFCLDRRNYTGKVWARERNGKVFVYNRLVADFWARTMVFLSVFNLTSGILRLRIKRTLQGVLPRLPLTKIVERRLLDQARYYIFSGPENSKRLSVIWRGCYLGEVIFQNNPANILHSAVFSVFSAVISAEHLKLYLKSKFPELFGSEKAGRTGAGA